jgi:protoheme IX farnesyltransferase
MWWDRDIDAKMERTKARPLASGKIKPKEALWVGMIISTLGVGLALIIDTGFGIIIFAGLFFDVVVYTIWLKRRTCLSIIWGGISGGMPILAGRYLGVGAVDWVGIVLSLGILLWIPTHILTFNIRYAKDYLNAGIPTVVSVYGTRVNHAMIAVSSILAAIAMGMAAWGIGMTWGCLRLLSVLSIGLVLLAVFMILRPSERINFGLFKYASVYMLSSMLLMVI